MWPMWAHVFDTRGWCETFRCRLFFLNIRIFHYWERDERDLLLTIIYVSLFFITSNSTFYLCCFFSSITLSSPFGVGMEKADARGKIDMEKKTVNAIRIYCNACTWISPCSPWTREEQRKKAKQNLWTPPTIANDRWESKGVDLWLYKLYSLYVVIHDSGFPMKYTLHQHSQQPHSEMRESNVNLFGHLNRNVMNKQFRWNKQAKKRMREKRNRARKSLQTLDFH